VGHVCPSAPVRFRPPDSWENSGSLAVSIYVGLSRRSRRFRWRPGCQITICDFSNPSVCPLTNRQAPDNKKQLKKYVYLGSLETVCSVRANHCNLTSPYLQGAFPQNTFNTSLSSSRRASLLGVKGTEREASN
jgi:hypothetical protein